jgi:flavin-dependent dehydrogenase
MFDFALVKEALEERGLLLTRLAPHLVRPVPFLYPLEHAWERPYVGAGVALYDTMAMTGRYDMGVPKHKHVFRKQLARMAPDIRTDNLHGAIRYYDCQVDDARLVMTIARTAANNGAHVATRTKVTGLIRDGDRVVGVRGHDGSGRPFEARASIVVGADGANSLVRRRVAAPFRRDQLSIATGFFAHGVTSAEIAIELTARPPGYIWSFPRPNHLAIGICAQADAGITAATLRARTASWIEATGIAAGAQLQPYSWPIPSLSTRDFETLPFAGVRWAVAGDAAGLVDPITREGIFFALASGEWIADALSGGDPSRTYSARVRDEAVSELRRAAQLKAGFFRPAFIDLLHEALRRSAAVRSVMADLVAGRQTYAQLKWRLIKTLEIGLIWRALTA